MREPISVYFTGDAEKTARENAVGFIAKTRKTLDVALYVLTEPSLFEALKEAKAIRDVAIRLLLDEQFLEAQDSISNGWATLLVGIGIEIKVDRRGGLMHHKFAVSDNKVWGKYACLTGSFNWSKAASKINRENLVILRQRKAVTRFSNEFERLWNHPKSVAYSLKPRGIELG